LLCLRWILENCEIHIHKEPPEEPQETEKKKWLFI